MTKLPGYDAWKTRSDDDGRFDDPPDEGPTELDMVYERVHQLEAALAPFADAFAKADNPGWSDLYDEQPESLHVSLGAWRKAHRLLMDRRVVK